MMQKEIDLLTERINQVQSILDDRIHYQVFHLFHGKEFDVRLTLEYMIPTYFPSMPYERYYCHTLNEGERFMIVNHSLYGEIFEGDHGGYDYHKNILLIELGKHCNAMPFDVFFTNLLLGHFVYVGND